MNNYEVRTHTGIESLDCDDSQIFFPGSHSPFQYSNSVNLRQSFNLEELN
jgi:hypothetical protein